MKKLLVAVALFALALGVARWTGIWSTQGITQKPGITKLVKPKAEMPKHERPVAQSDKRNGDNIPLWIFKLPVAEQEQKCLALNIYYEARSESDIGMSMVAYVTDKRKKLGRSYWGSTICENVFKKRISKKKNKRTGKVRIRIVCEFSWACMSKVRPNPHNFLKYTKALQIARKQLEGEFTPPAKLVDALYYLRPAHSSRNGRAFFKKLVYLDTVGHHQFYGERKA